MGDLMGRRQRRFTPKAMIWYGSNKGNLRCDFSKAQLNVNQDQNFGEGA
jgi:hypothetical protein